MPPIESPVTPTAYHADPPTPYDVLLGGIDFVIGEWRTLVKAEPWGAMPPARLMDAVPELLPKLLRLARRNVLQVDPELSELIAEHHGWFRRGDGIPLTAVAEEWNHLKRACWKVMLSHAVREEAATEALRRLDVLFDDAIGYSLRGYYAPELDRLRGRGLERRDEVDDRRAGPPNRRTDLPES